MSRRAAKFRRQHELSIDDNPSEILIKREQRVESGGGFREETLFVGRLHARLYQETTGRSGRAAIEVTEPGLLQRNERWGLMAPVKMRAVNPQTGALLIPEQVVNTELLDGPHVKDTFEHDGMHFEITKVWPREDQGVTWGYVCELEEVE